jgi:small subunit ribosomal protein S24e
MAIKIITNNENVLLDKKEIVAEIEFQGSTPNKAEVKKSIASTVGGDEKLVVVKIIKTGYGSQKAKVVAHVYNSKEQMLRLEKAERKQQVSEAKTAEGVQEKKEGEQ